MGIAMVLGMTTMVFAANDGTITVTNATKGITYTAYKLFDATLGANGAVSYTVPAAKKDSVSTTLFDIGSVADANGNYTISKKSGASDSDVLEWVKTNYQTFAGNAITGAWETESTYKFTGLAYGYYYITSSLGTVVTIDTTTPNAEVKDKNDSTPETPEKVITAEDAAIAGSDATFTPGVESNEAAVGSIESFEVTFDAVNWITTTDSSTGEVTTTQAKQWKFSDTPTGLDIDANTVKVFVTDNGTEKEITSTITDKTKSDAGVLSFTIPWIDADQKSLYQPKVAGAGETQTAKIPVKVTYDAKILPAAATAVAPNHIEVKYTNSSDVDVSIGTDDTNTYTYKFKLDKAKADYTDLLGAKFELYLGSVADANKVHFTVSGTTYTVAETGGVTEIDLTSSATATIIGLDKQTYVLRETKVPDGYNQAADQTVADTVLKRVDQEITDVAATITGDDGVVTVVNNQGSELPSTGGMGTTIFYIIGVILLAGAAIVLVTRRRMNAE